MKESEIKSIITEKLGIESLNDMQRAMAEKSSSQELVLLAPTGSGKTLAFAMNLMKNLKEPTGYVQAVIIAPSRELTIQIYNVIRPISGDFKVTCCYGGHKFEDEKNSLEVVPDILVSTPGRLLDHINRGNVELYQTRILIIDEFDKSLELGFSEEMKRIIRRMKNVSRRILTSATQIDSFPEFIPMKNALTINYLQENKTENRLTIFNVHSEEKDKLQALLQLLNNLENGKTIIFLNHRESAERVFAFLESNRLSAVLYHGGLEQNDREKAIAMLNNGSKMILVTTDLGARGLDIEKVKSIIHYHLPVNVETYTHRNGRTARINESGAIYIITSDTEKVPDFIEFDEDFKLDKDAILKIKNDYSTLFFSAGKKEKISKGDVVGFLISKGGLNADEIGKIDVFDHHTLVAVRKDLAKATLSKIAKEKIKNKRIRITLA